MTRRPESLAGALAVVRGRPELGALRRGIEKESLRVTPTGALAATPHPRGLGSPLTHPHITTDFSEAQLELITGVHTSAEDVLGELADVHRFVHANIGDELLWAASMPCILGPEAEIPVARFGSSNAGRSKSVYRMGLSYRYGRLMQTISGIHYNFSVPEALMSALARDRVSGRGFRDREVFRPDPQLPPLLVAADLPLRGISGRVQVIRSRFGWRSRLTGGAP